MLARILYMWVKHGAFSKQGRKNTRKKSVRIISEDLHKGNTLFLLTLLGLVTIKLQICKKKIIIKITISAKKRMGKEDGGLARHTMECQRCVDWENVEIVTRERGLKQRKVLEGIESLQQRHYV